MILWLLAVHFIHTVPLRYRFWTEWGQVFLFFTTSCQINFSSSWTSNKKRTLSDGKLVTQMLAYHIHQQWEARLRSASLSVNPPWLKITSSAATFSIVLGMTATADLTLWRLLRVFFLADGGAASASCPPLNTMDQQMWPYAWTLWRSVIFVLQSRPSSTFKILGVVSFPPLPQPKLIFKELEYEEKRRCCHIIFPLKNVCKVTDWLKGFVNGLQDINILPSQRGMWTSVVT